jgi:arylformamidase
VLVSVNYRMLPQTKPLDQAHDVAQALAAAQKQARNWGGDPDRFVLMGHSAGAHLVALLSANPDMATSQGARPWLGSVLLDSAAFDVTQIMQTPKHYGFYDKAFGQDPAYWQAASPAQILKSGAHPMLAVCSSRRADSCAQAQAFVDKAKGLAIQSSVLTQGMSHSEINQELGKDVAYTQSVDKFLNGLPGLTPASKP